MRQDLFFMFYKARYRAEYFIDLACRYYVSPNSQNLNLLRVVAKHGLHWSKIYDIISRDKLQPILLELVNNQALRIPDIFLEKILKDRLMISHSSKTQDRSFRRLMIRLSRAKLMPLVMKTYVYKKQLFNDSDFKVNRDLDLLVKRSEFPLGAKLLLELGYRYYPNQQQNVGFDQIPQEDSLNPKSQVTFKHSRASVELHTRIIDIPIFKQSILTGKDVDEITAWFISKGRTMPWHSVAMKTLPPGPLFLNLFLHTFFQHNFQFALAYLEAALLVKKFRNQINWLEIIELIKTYHLESYFYWYLYILNDIYSLSYPPEISIAVNRFTKSMSVYRRLLFLYTKYRLHHPSKISEWQNLEREKRIYWRLIKTNTRGNHRE